MYIPQFTEMTAAATVTSASFFGRRSSGRSQDQRRSAIRAMPTAIIDQAMRWARISIAPDDWSRCQ